MEKRIEKNSSITLMLYDLTCVVKYWNDLLDFSPKDAEKLYKIYSILNGLDTPKTKKITKRKV